MTEVVSTWQIGAVFDCRSPVAVRYTLDSASDSIFQLQQLELSMSTAPSFPYARYISLLGAHSLLLIFTALFIPRTSLLVAPLPAQASSQDKPQHPFLHPITADPALTLAWLCAGVLTCQIWWASWLRMWWREYETEQSVRFGVEKSDAERRIENVETAAMKFAVSSGHFVVVEVSSNDAEQIIEYERRFCYDYGFFCFVLCYPHSLWRTYNYTFHADLFAWPISLSTCRIPNFIYPWKALLRIEL